ncbi:MAG: hypothetical protein H7257_12240 [Taibaiella sp.]|nr:hypothetical protein [Taibaiella sp.]
MKIIITAVLLLCSYSGYSQQTNDTLYVKGSKYAIVKKIDMSRWLVQSVAGDDLIEIHYSGIHIKGTPVYVLTFLKDKRQAAFSQHNNARKNVVDVLLNNNLIAGLQVNQISEDKYARLHPLPVNYTDISEAIEY